MRTREIDYTAAVCPCCHAARSDVGGEWPWLCQCYKGCEVAAMGRSCGGPGKCWDGCPYRAPENACASQAAVRLTVHSGPEPELGCPSTPKA